MRSSRSRCIIQEAVNTFDKSHALRELHPASLDIEVAVFYFWIGRCLCALPCLGGMRETGTQFLGKF